MHDIDFLCCIWWGQRRMDIFIGYAREDSLFANWLSSELQRKDFSVFLDTSDLIPGTMWQNEIEKAIRACRIMLLVLSPHSMASKWVKWECMLAQHYGKKLVPLQIAHLPQEPEFVRGLQLVDLTALPMNAVAISHIVSFLPKIDQRTLGIVRDAYLQRATLKSDHTITAYRRAIELFLEFLGDPSQRGRLPVHSRVPPAPDDTRLNALTAADAPIFLHFAEWMLSSPTRKSDDKRPYKVSTVELRLAGVQNWFQFMDDHGWLPADFPLAKAKRIVRDELRGRSRHAGPPEPPLNIEEVIYFYDDLKPPRRLTDPDARAERRERWELTRLRNCALLRALAESGGRVSEVLSLNLDDFPERSLQRDDVLRVAVRGKGGHVYHLRFHDALPAIRAYIERRGAALRATRAGKVPLFVSHDARYDGARMSRIVAWRVVQRAARALGLGSITPHDFRHWRATQLLNAGYPLDVVQDYLGHRSVETTRAYYAHTDPLRVDDAARSVGLPRPSDDDSQSGESR